VIHLLYLLPLHTFFRNWACIFFDQSCDEVAAEDTTAISTPLDRVPLYIVSSCREPIMLLKYSQATSSSARLRLGIPESCIFRSTTLVQKNKDTKTQTEKHTMFDNGIRTTVPTSSTAKRLQFPFYYIKLRVYSVQLVFKCYGLDYNNYTPKPYLTYKLNEYVYFK